MMFIARILRLMAREFRILWSDWKLMVIVFIMPFAYTALVCFLYIPQRVTDVPIHVIDNDNSVISRNLLNAIERSESFSIVHKNGTMDDFKTAVRRDKAFACIIIPRDFQNNVKDGKTSRILTVVDGTNLLLANTIRGGITEIGGTYSVGVLMKRVSMRGTPTNYAQTNSIPIEVSTRVAHIPTFSYAAFVIPGMFGVVIQQIILLGVALTFSRERDKNWFPQVLAISSSPLEVLSAKTLFYLVLNLASSCIIFAWLPKFGVNISGSVGLLFFLLFLFVFAVVGIGVCFSAVLGDQLFATEALMLIATPSFLLSGFTWPQFAMIPVIKFFSDLLPLTHFVMPLRTIIYEQASMNDVYPHFMWLWVCSVICYGIAYIFVWKYMAAAKRDMKPAMTNDLKQPSISVPASSPAE